ncbi:redox-active disulfide protein 2 [Nubsella zeaxanthinifaciens]|uniref:redox-active disulfide protein 2 n=1 Tax=Nubsella zeaxanthinifaciens TaxID=392412 RepID=UPI000DE35017|nr:redox-active disulfide protein 2 [Nubsella zeaxanthinifaciens]
MKEENLTQLSTEELHKKAKTLKVATIALFVSMLLMLISGIILTAKKGFSALTVTPVSFLPLVIIFSAQLKKVNEELKKRNA